MFRYKGFPPRVERHTLNFGTDRYMVHLSEKTTGVADQRDTLTHPCSVLRKDGMGIFVKTGASKTKIQVEIC